MKDAILLELAVKWERESVASGVADGSKEAERGNAIDQGNREGKSECAGALRLLIELIGDAV